jgi:hypothetical protein
MPTHNTATQSKVRSPVTGRQLGKRAAKAEVKVAESVMKFVDIVERTASAKFWPERIKAEPKAIPGQSEGVIMGRVIRNHGAGRLEVRLFSGEVVSAPVAGRIAFRGNAATKTDREACMCAGDYIVVDGIQAAGKMRVTIAKRIAALYQSANPRLAPPKEFFDEGAEADQGFDFDRSEEEDAEVELLAAGGGGGSGGKSSGRSLLQDAIGAAKDAEEAPVDVDDL